MKASKALIVGGSQSRFWGLFKPKPRNGLVGHDLVPEQERPAGVSDPAEIFRSEMEGDTPNLGVPDKKIVSPTLAIVEKDRPQIIRFGTSINRADFIRDHPLTSEVLADALTVEILREVVEGMRTKAKDTRGLWYRNPVSRKYTNLGDCMHHGLGRNLAIFSDPHGHWRRLDVIINRIDADLRAGKIELHCGGDLPHAERRENMFNLAWSLRTVKAYIMLMWLFPDLVHLYPGNHDIFCPTDEHFSMVMDFIGIKPHGDIYDLKEYLTNRGYFGNSKEVEAMTTLKSNLKVPQAYLFLHYICLALQEQNVKPQQACEVVRLFQKFIDYAPLCLRAVSPNKEIDMLLSHSLPLGFTLPGHLDMIRDDEKRLRSVLWARHHHKEGTEVDYTASDFAALSRAIHMSENGVSVVGHDPDPRGHDWLFKPFGNSARVLVVHTNIDYRYGFILVRMQSNGRYRMEPVSIECGPPNDPEELYLAH